MNQAPPAPQSASFAALKSVRHDPAIQGGSPSATLKHPKVVFAANTSWYLYNHQRNILAGFLEDGYEVHVLVPPGAFCAKLKDIGCRVHTLPLIPASRNPLREALTASVFIRRYRMIRPDLVVHYTIKCNLYGGFAAGRLGIPFINNLTGLGSAFRSQGWFSRLASLAYRVTQSKAAHVYFQNPADFDFMRDQGLVSETQALLLPGSGVDLNRFRPVTPGGTTRTGRTESTFVFVFIGRLLHEKGIAELAAAMERVKTIAPGAVCRVYGFLESGDPRFVTRDELNYWEARGILEYQGVLEDVRPGYEKADCVVLPSYYREGIPKSLLEAAAMGLPIIATSLAGCRAIVQDNVNGFLCEPRNADSLAATMLRMLSIGAEARARMGQQGRRIVEAAFSEERVTSAHLEAARTLVKRTAVAP